LHIQGDGTFLAARGGANMPADSVIWEITSTPDPSSGLAEIAVIPLTVDTLIVGNINGLEAGSAQGSPTLTLTADTTELHPWIQVPPKTGDTTTVVLSALSGQQAAEGLTVELRSRIPPVRWTRAHNGSPRLRRCSDTRLRGHESTATSGNRLLQAG
jgi:hypothetical protein